MKKFLQKIAYLNFQKEKDFNFDVVVTHFVELCTSFYKKIEQFGKPYIIAVDHNPRPVNGFKLKKRLKNKLKGKLYSFYINKFIGVSEYTKKQILKDYGKDLSSKTEVIYNGISFEEYDLRSEANHGKFIVASHLRPSKGIQDLINAVSLLNPDLKQQLKIDIFGEGPMETELKAMVRKKHLEDQFTFVAVLLICRNFFRIIHIYFSLLIWNVLVFRFSKAWRQMFLL